jgi:hypothetical protein
MPDHHIREKADRPARSVLISGAVKYLNRGCGGFAAWFWHQRVDQETDRRVCVK